MRRPRTFDRARGPALRVALTVALVACAGSTSAGGPAPPAPATALPPVPLATGRLAVRVQYPSAEQVIQARDSNFIFGSVGHGRAALTINGAAVRVLPNGAFLAWLPLPPAGDPRYELVATLGGETARLALPIRLASSRGAAAPTAGAPAAAALASPDDIGRAAGATAEIPPARTDAATEDGPDASGPTRWAVLGGPALPLAVPDSEPTVIARPVPRGTYKWFLFPGTVVAVTGAQGGARRVQLDGRLAVWVDSALVRDTLIPPAGARAGSAAVAPRRVAGNLRVVPAAGWVDVVIPVGERPPFLVEEKADALVLTLYSTQANSDVIHHLANDTLVRNITWAQEASDRARYVIGLARAPYGYLAFWRGSSFVLRVRRPPPVSERRPLSGLTIAVDPGHPPIGATGPTGLYEAVPALAVGKRLQALLEERGARVVMTRTTDAPVALGDRPLIARRANAHALVSIHLNALPDGINPLAVNGTGTYFFHPHAEPLARHVQRGMVRRMGLRDLGVYYDNLALARPTWMPSVLCEGAFIIVPEHEAALRTPEFQDRYARGVADGLEAYFRALPTR